MSARIRFRPRITKKTCGFFLPSARIRLLPISGKKTFLKKTSSFREIKNILPAIFFLLPFINFFLMKVKSFVLFRRRDYLFKKFVQCFFYLDALINFFKNSLNVCFFLNLFFPPPPPSLDFEFFLMENREIKQSGLTFRQILPSSAYNFIKALQTSQILYHLCITQIIMSENRTLWYTWC